MHLFFSIQYLVRATPRCYLGGENNLHDGNGRKGLEYMQIETESKVQTAVDDTTEVKSFIFLWDKKLVHPSKVDNKG